MLKVNATAVLDKFKFHKNTTLSILNDKLAQIKVVFQS